MTFSISLSTVLKAVTKLIKEGKGKNLEITKETEDSYNVKIK